MFHVKHLFSRALAWVTADPAVRLPAVELPPDVPRETSRVSYGEMLARARAYRGLRDKIDALLIEQPTLPGGQITGIKVESDTNDLLVIGEFGDTERVYRISITVEPADVPRETSKEG